MQQRLVNAVRPIHIVCNDNISLYYSQLLRSPAFHRGVHGIHKRLHRWKHGTPPEELGGTNLDGMKPDDGNMALHCLTASSST